MGFLCLLFSHKRTPSTNDFRVIENNTLEYGKIKYYAKECLQINKSFIKKNSFFEFDLSKSHICFGKT
jgi:hypothetical protein